MLFSSRIVTLLALSAAVYVGVYWVFSDWLHTAHRSVAARRELRLVGRGVQSAVEHALRDEKSGDIAETISTLAKVDPGLHVIVFDGRGAMMFHSEGLDEADPRFGPLIERALREPAAELFDFDSASHPDVAWYVLPLRLDEASTGYLGLSWRLDGIESDMAPIVRLGTWTVVGFVLLSLVLGSVYGRRYIEAPLGALRRALERTRDGDFNTQLPPVDRRDELGRVMAVFNDMGRQIAASRQQLQSELEDRQQLQQAIQRLDKLASIGLLAAGLAHEIGSPLQVLTGRARSLHRRADQPDEVRRIADILTAQGERITRIVEQLLHLVRPQPIERQPINPRGAVVAVVDLLQVEARRVGVALRFTEAATPVQTPLILASVDQLQQITFNLTINALCWTPRGGDIEVRVSFGDLPSPPATSPAKPAWILSVTDTGSGLPPGLEPQIFEPFVTTRANEGGSGLGLAVVKHIATSHDGCATARTRPEGGSEFCVYLPLLPASEAPHPEPTAASPPQSPRATSSPSTPALSAPAPSRPSLPPFSPPPLT